METDKEDIEIESAIIEKRGFVITQTISLEGIIDSIITDYFIERNNRKKKQFHGQMLSILNSKSKIEILRFILNKIIDDSSEKDQIKKMFKTLIAIYKIRNGMAHWQWTSVVLETKVVTFFDRKKEFTQLFDDKLVDSFLKDCKFCHGLLSKLYFKYLFKQY